MTDLKPCPFCGTDSCNLAVKEDENGPFIYCARCDAVYTIANGTTEQIIKGWNRRTTDDLKDLLIDIDSWHELLGTELLKAFYDGYFDPDANFTPLEHHLKLLYEALGFNKDEIRNEAYKLSKKRLGEKEGEE